MYKFKLQTLLKYREKLEEDKKNELAVAIQTHLKEVSRLEQIQNELSEVKECIYNKLYPKENIKIDLLEIERLKGYYSYLEQQKKKQNQRIIETEEVVEDKRKILITASKEKRMIETLKEKDFEEYQYKMLLIEQTKIDELVSFKFSTNSSL